MLFGSFSRTSAQLGRDFNLRFEGIANKNGLKASSLSSMSSEIGLAVGTRMMHVHALVNAARNQTASEPAAK